MRIFERERCGWAQRVRKWVWEKRERKRNREFKARNIDGEFA